MTFREYGQVEPRVVSAYREEELEAEISEIGSCRDIIDLQYASSYDTDKKVTIFSALLLIKK